MKNLSLSIRQRQTSKRTFNRNNYRIVMQLYDISKVQIKEVPRLPANDFRRGITGRKTVKPVTTHLVSVRKALMKIAALW